MIALSLQQTDQHSERLRIGAEPNDLEHLTLSNGLLQCISDGVDRATQYAVQSSVLSGRGLCCRRSAVGRLMDVLNCGYGLALV